jgi:hypothetical protein
MTLFVFFALLALAVTGSTRTLGADPSTWSPKVNETETGTPDKCLACKTIVNFIENQQKICTVVPKNMEAVCEQLVHEYPPNVVCNDLCVKTKTYEIHL